MECQQAFDTIKKKLVSPVLAFPDYTKEFILDTDASDTGIGFVLSQVQDDGSERVVAYASRLLSKAERRYSVTHRELLAVVIFISHFRQYLLGQSFLLRTDHNSLAWLQNYRNPEGQLARWLERLEEYSFTIQHRPGQQHLNADALSRRPYQEGEAVNVVSSHNDKVDLSLLGKSKQELQALQLEDPILKFVLEAKEKGECPPLMKSRGKAKTRKLIQIWDQLMVSDGVLGRNFVDEKRGLCFKQIVIWDQLMVSDGVLGRNFVDEKCGLCFKQIVVPTSLKGSIIR